MARTRLDHRRLVVYLPQHLIEKLHLVLYDPTLRRPKYGAFSKLITSLLQQWLASLPSKKGDFHAQ